MPHAKRSPRLLTRRSLESSNSAFLSTSTLGIALRLSTRKTGHRLLWQTASSSCVRFGYSSFCSLMGELGPEHPCDATGWHSRSDSGPMGLSLALYTLRKSPMIHSSEPPHDFPGRLKLASWDHRHPRGLSISGTGNLRWFVSVHSTRQLHDTPERISPHL